jgi:Domain of unknown function (DUF4167)
LGSLPQRSRFRQQSALQQGKLVDMHNINRKDARPRHGPRNAAPRSHGFKSSTSLKGSGNDFANAQGKYNRYMELARSAMLTGDMVETENCYQHAEHYFRLMKGQTT